MKRLFKSVVATTATAAMVASMGASAFANAEMQNMQFAGYDTTKAHEGFIYRIYNEVIDGKFTNKQILERMYAPELEWKHEGYEGAYPHAGYDRLYLDGNRQDILRYNNLYPQWDIRRSDYEWEVKYPHSVWERRQTKINNETWTWDFGMEFPEGNAKFMVPDAELKTKTEKKALNVEYTYENYGFGKYGNDGLPVDGHEVTMYNEFINNVNKESEAVQKLNKKPVADLAIADWNELLPGQTGVAVAWDAVETYNEYKALEPYKTKESIEAEEAWINADKTGLLSWDALSKRKNDGKVTKYVVTDEMIQALIPVVKSEFITAQLNATTPADTKDVADLYHTSLRKGYDWEWDTERSFKVRYDAEIAWTAPVFQKTEPYSHYQFLIVNGVVCDGSFVEIPVEDAEEWRTELVQKPYIGRYTDGIATPNVEWKFYCYDVEDVVNAAGEPSTVFPVIEQKFIDGEAVIENGAPVLRVAANRFGTKYVVDLGERLEIRICEGAKGVNDLVYVPADKNEDEIYKYEGNVGGIVNNFGGSAADVELHIPADRHPQDMINELRAIAVEAETQEIAADIVADIEKLEAKITGEVADEATYEAALDRCEIDAYKEYLAMEAPSIGAMEYRAEYVEANLEAYITAHYAAHVDAYKAYLAIDPDDRQDYELFKEAWIAEHIDAYIEAYVFSVEYGVVLN